MLILIDTCCFHCVFDTGCTSHTDFAPVLAHVLTGKSRLVSGGTKYKLELSKQEKYLRVMTELARSGRVVVFRDNDVDRTALELKGKVPDADFDDEHLVALVIVSKCRLVCTNDKRADEYLKDRGRRMYPKGLKKPAIYRYQAHRSLLR
jgi:predicted nucleic acid-binding protein